jgi:hypothetical protein
MNKESLETNSNQLKEAVSSLDFQAKKRFNAALGEIKGILKQYGDEGILAMSTVSSDIMLEYVNND